MRQHFFTGVPYFENICTSALIGIYFVPTVGIAQALGAAVYGEQFETVELILKHPAIGLNSVHVCDYLSVVFCISHFSFDRCYPSCLCSVSFSFFLCI